MSEFISWHSIYREFAKKLDEFYEKNKKHSAQKFYSLCISKNKEKFQELNKWIKKFDDNKENRSIDPFHIFASFNNFNISIKRRKEVLAFYFDVLGMDKEIIENVQLDIFKFFPHPQIQKIVSNRELWAKIEIWEFFHALINSERNILRECYNNKINNWYGIGQPFLTIFMFWIDSNKYIPLDKNTDNLLKLNKIIKTFPIVFDDYCRIINIETITNNLFRNLTHYAIEKNFIHKLSLEEQNEVKVFLRSRIDYESNLNKKNFDDDFEAKVNQALNDSQDKRIRRLELADKQPILITVSTNVYRRNPDVVAEVLVRANGICQNCKKEAPFIRAKDNTLYLEVHHIVQLANGGDDTIDNSIALCPNCHRKMHFGLLDKESSTKF